jgi:hypothetical protein
MSDFYQRLGQDDGLSSLECWDDVSVSVRALFAQIRSIRAGSQDGVQVEDRAVADGNMLWAILQTPLVEEMMTLQWDGHPAVQSVLSLHVFRRSVTPEAFSELTSKVKALTSKVDGLETRLENVEKKKSS